MTTQDDRTIRQAVVDRYGERARRTLESAGLDVADDACCAPASAEGTTTTVQLLDEVPPGAVASAEAAGDSGEYGTANYAVEVLDELPATVSGASAGCGNPVAIAELSEGEAVLDLGSGGGHRLLPLRAAGRRQRRGVGPRHDAGHGPARAAQRGAGRRRECPIPPR